MADLQTKFQLLLDMITEQVKNPAYSKQLDTLISTAGVECATISGQPLPPMMAAPAPSPLPSRNASAGLVNTETVMGVGAWISVGAGVVFIFALLVAMHRCRAAQRQDRRLPDFKQLHEDARRDHLVSSTRSMARSSGVVPLYARVLVPLLLCVNTVMFVTGTYQGLKASGETVR